MPRALAGSQPASQADRKQEKTALRPRGNPHWAPRRVVTQSPRQPERTTLPPQPPRQGGEEATGNRSLYLCTKMQGPGIYQVQIPRCGAQTKGMDSGILGLTAIPRCIFLKEALPWQLQQSTPLLKACSSETQGLHEGWIHHLSRCQAIPLHRARPLMP